MTKKLYIHPEVQVTDIQTMHAIQASIGVNLNVLTDEQF